MRRSNAPSKLGGLFSPTGLSNSTIKSSIENRKPVAPVENATRSTQSILGLISKAKLSSEVEVGENSEDQNSILDHSEPTPVVLSESAQNILQPQTNKRVFNVVYGKPTKKKHKTWEGDGILEVGEKSLTLKDCDGNILGRGSGKKNSELEEGSRLFVGSKEVEIIDAISPNAVVPCSKRSAEPSSPHQPKPKKAKIAGRFSSLNFAPPRKPHNVTEPYDPLEMPQPDLDHQWQFNSGGGPVSQVSVEPSLAKVLRKHQREGVVFLYRCVTGLRDPEHTGAILADEMGLGKTLQCITLIWTLLHHGLYGRPLCRKVLIVAPSSLTRNWHQEFMRWLGCDRIHIMVIDQKNKPKDFLNQPNIPVMIISYEMFVRYYDDVSQVAFDLLICDEGHRLKNNSIRAATLLCQLACPRKVLLTGTPVQNDLQEFYALVNVVNPNILGTYLEFRKEYEDPIVLSRQPEADAWSRIEGERAARDLARLTAGFVLRRTHTVIDRFLPTKTEVVLFCKPSPLQRALYEAAVSCWEDADRGVSHLAVITTLRKISSHPALLADNTAEVDIEKQKDYLSEFLCSEYQRLSEGRATLEDSSKLSVVAALLHSTAQLGERVVLVSYFTQTLDLLAALCDQYGWQHCRLDGNTPTARRVDIVNNFNSPHSNDAVFLLSARAGGVGLNLTGASRLVLYDSDWNPASDLQAMSRIWRDGQKKSVQIYRLLTTGSIEEKIFQRQLSKAGLSEAVVDPTHASSVRLSDDELKDLFSLDSLELDSDCLTHKRLPCQCEGKGSAPRPAASLPTPRHCQLLASGPAPSPAAPTLRINQLFQWQHYAAPMPPQLLQMNGAPPLVPISPAPAPAPEPPPSPSASTRYMVQWDEHANHLTTRLGYLLEHQSLVDVTLMCNTHTLKVHRSVLAACSPYFEMVLQRQLGNHPLIVLKDMKFCVLKSLVEFMYCGETSVSSENLHPLMEAAKFFEVKGLSTMTKDVFNNNRGSSPMNNQENGSSSVPPFRGRSCRRGSASRGRQFSSASRSVPPQETAQIMLSLSGGGDGHLQPQPVTLQNGTGVKRAADHSEQRRRGRARGISRGRARDLTEDRYSGQAFKKEVVDIRKDLELLNLPEPKNNGDEQSPLLASLLSKAEALGRTKIKTESPDGERQEETVVYQFDGESNSATKYLDALKEAGLPTDVPVLIDAGDGTYVTLTEDVLRQVLGNNSDEFQFQVTEATLARGEGEVCEGVVQQDGSVTVTGKCAKANGPLLTMGKRSVSIKGIKSKKDDKIQVPTPIPDVEATPVPLISSLPEMIRPANSTPATFSSATSLPASFSQSTFSPSSSLPGTFSPTIASLGHNKGPAGKKSVQELINEAVMESLKNGAASEAEADPDAVVLFEVTDNDEVCKYVVSSKEVSALKALNEQIERKKNQNSPVGKKSPTLPTVPTVIDGNTNIAEIKLAIPKNSRKSIVSEVLARAYSLESLSNRMNNSMVSNDNVVKTSYENSFDMLNIDMETDVLNDPADIMNAKSSNAQLGNQSLSDFNGESQMVVDEQRMEVVNEEQEIMEIVGQNDEININKSLLGDCINSLGTKNSDMPAKLNEYSQSLQINESAPDIEGTTEAEKLNSDSTEYPTVSNRDMPLLENETEIANMPLVISNRKVDVDLNEVIDSNHEKSNDFMNLLNVVCEGASQELKNTKESFPDRMAEKENMIPSDHSDYIASRGPRSTEHSVLDEVQKLGELLDDGKCQDLSVEQALQEMMGEENSCDYNEVEPEKETQDHQDFNLIESNVDDSFNLDHKASPNPAEKPVGEALTDDIPDESTNNVDCNLGEVENSGRIITSENLESSLISPTKDIPFAVGLLPLKDALEQMQANNERSTRKTRSSSLNKRENSGTKKPSSVDMLKEATAKRRKSSEGGVVKNGKASKQDNVPT